MQVQMSAPFANGDMMDKYDRRTFGPKLSKDKWGKTLKSLEMAATKLSEVRRVEGWEMRAGTEL